MYNEIVIAYVKVLSHHLPGGNEGNHKSFRVTDIYTRASQIQNTGFLLPGQC